MYLIEEHLENTSKYFLSFQITFRVFLNRTRIAVENKIKVLEKRKNLKPTEVTYWLEATNLLFRKHVYKL